MNNLETSSHSVKLGRRISKAEKHRQKSANSSCMSIGLSPSTYIHTTTLLKFSVAFLFSFCHFFTTEIDECYPSELPTSSALSSHHLGTGGRRKVPKEAIS